MKTKFTIGIITIAVILSATTMLQAQPFTLTGNVIHPTVPTNRLLLGSYGGGPFGFPFAVNRDTITGSLSSHPLDSVGISAITNGVAFMGVTKVFNSTPPRNAIFGTDQVLSDIIFVNRVNSTYTYYERMRINRFGRVSINTPAADTSALLDIYDDHRGLLIPRIALTSVTDGATIPLPAKSLLVWNNTLGGLNPEGYFYNAGNSSSPNWVQLATTMNWQLNGNAGTTPSTAPIGSTVNNNFIGTTDNKDVVMATNNLERVRIKNNGNVGVGTSSPPVKFSVYNGNAESIRLIGNGTGGSIQGTSAIGFQQFTMTNPSAMIQYREAGLSTNKGEIGIFTNGTNSDVAPIERLTVMSNGNIAINTTNSASKLGVAGEVAIGSGYVGTVAPSNGAIIEGNVGIGTTSPPIKLSVSNGNAESIRLIGNGTGGSIQGTSAIGFQQFSMTNPSAMIQYREAGLATNNGEIGIFTNGSGSDVAPTERLTILSGGNVGIATTNPAYKLDVNGTTQCTGNIWTSDQQFKKNVDSIASALTIIKQLKPKSYFFDTTNVYGFNFQSTKQYGFLAQDVEQILPELVFTSNQQEEIDSLGNVVHPAITYKSLSYISFISILTKGIQELQFKNQDLQTKIGSQDSVNTALTTDNVMLKDKVSQLAANTILMQDQLNQLMASVNNCCAATRSMQITGANDVVIESTKQMDVRLNDVTTIVLNQNSPNPFREQTTITYYLPENTGKSQMLFYNAQGSIIKTVDLIQKGNGQINVFADNLTDGIYTYTLVVDNKIIETKKMIKH